MATTINFFLRKLFNPMLICGGGILFVVVYWTVIYPAYRSPHSRLYSSTVGYPSLMRMLDRPIAVEAQPVSMREMVRVVSGNGTIGYLNEIPINSEITGIINRVNVQPGDTVEVGQVLLTLDTGGHVSRIAELDLELRQSEHTQVAENYSREKESYNRGIISLTELQRFKLSLDEATIAYAKAKEAYQNSLRSRSRSVIGNRGATPDRRAAGQPPEIEILSPITGTVISRNVIRGENLVHPTNNLMVIGNEPVFRSALDQRYISKVEKGNKAMVYVSAYPGIEFFGEVVRVDYQISELKSASKSNQPPFTFYAWIAISPRQRADFKLVEGMHGYSILEYPMKTLAIPDSALIRFSGQGGLVMQVNPSNRIQLTPVTYTMSSDGWVAIASGLEAGNTVIVNGQTALFENDRVSVQ